MNKRSIAMTAALLVVGLIAGIGPAQAKTHPPKTTTTVVRGAYVDDISCAPTGATPHADDPTTFDISCDGGSLFTGGLDGHTVFHWAGTMDAAGNIAAQYDEWFYGTYSGEDGSFGGIHAVGTFSVDGKTSTFTAHARIVAGTCSFAGAGGTFDANGLSVSPGGYVITLIRPNPAPVPAPTCNPIDPVPVSP